MSQERSPTSATGGLTEHERSTLARHHRLWVERANRTAPIEAGHIVPAIKSLYQAANLGEPRVAIVPSLGALAFAGTFASFIWERRKTDPDYLSAFDFNARPSGNGAHDAIADATLRATAAAVDGVARRNDAAAKAGDLTLNATYANADALTADAMDRQTNNDIRWNVDTDALTSLYNRIGDAMKDPFGNPMPTPVMVAAANGWAQNLAKAIFPNQEDAESAMQQACDWWRHTQSGNNGAYWDYCITAARDVVGLKLPQYAAYVPWENCAIHGSTRYMHPEFCLVSDFPSEIRSEASVYRWRDGWEV